MLFLNRLAGDNMSLRGPADLVELVSHEAGSGKWALWSMSDLIADSGAAL
jgi:hypothetical protein